MKRRIRGGGMRAWREHLLVIAFFLAVVFLFTLPFSIHLADHVLAIPVDNLLNAYFMAWNAHALVTNPTALFQANFNYPSRDVLAFSEHLFTLGVLSMPLRLVSRNPILAHNLILLTCFALCGYTMYLLARYLTGDRAAALVGAFFFTFVPYHFSTIVHAHVTLYFLQPLVLYFLIRYFEGGGKRYLLGFGLAFLSQALLSWYQLAFSTIPVGLYLLWRLVSIRRRRHLISLVGACLVLVACLSAVVPFALPYLRLRKNVLDEESRPAENPVLEAKPSDYRRVIDENLLYSHTRFLNKGHIGEGNALFPGFLVFPLVALALLSLFLGRIGSKLILQEDPPQPPTGDDTGDGESWGPGMEDASTPHGLQQAYPSPPEALCAGMGTSALEPGRGATPERDGAILIPKGDPGNVKKDLPIPSHPERNKPGSYIIFFFLLAAFCFILSTGRRFLGGENLLFKFLIRLPIFSLVRFPIRYHIVVVLSLATLAAYGTAWLRRLLQYRGRLRAAFVLPCALLAFMFVEFSALFMPFGPVPVGAAVPQVYRDLADMERGVVLEAPTPKLVNFSDYEDPLVINYGNVDNAINAAFREQLAIYYTTYHWQKLVNGMSGYYPLFYRRVLAEMVSFPSRRSLSFLRALGIRYLVLHWDYFPGNSGQATRAYLETLPGLTPLRDYPPDITLYLLEGLETLPATELASKAYVPEKVNLGETFNASLGLSNPTDRPFINTDEYRMHLRLSWKDASGREALVQEAYYYFPFYIHPGEGKIAGFKSRSPKEEGKYELTITALDGPLRGATWDTSVTVSPVPPGRGGEGLEGRLSIDPGVLQGMGHISWEMDPGGSARLRLRLEPGELFSLPVLVANLGTSGWSRAIPGDIGRVEVTAFWDSTEAPELRKVQHGLLPCDLSPGQRSAFFVALQAPWSPGDYTLSLGLNCLCVSPLGTPVTISVEVR
ncbi:MAG: hypothetical protein ACUVT4_04265 [Actinomycetota bacterium]